MRLIILFLFLTAVPVQAAQSLRILLTNDDGYDSPGITAVHDALTAAGHDVYLVAPATQQSGSSAAITASGVEVTRHPGKVWAVHGRPADAVRFGLGYVLYDNPPDLVVSGANFGQNTGQEVNISGTVGAAVTAFKLGTPAIAISVGIRLEEAKRGFPSTFGAFPGAARSLARIIDNMKLEDMTGVLNVNYPAARPLDVKGVRWTELSSHALIGKRYHRNAEGKYAPELQGTDPNTRAYDAELVNEGYMTLTYLDGDMSVPARRSQKYLGDHLLDRDFEIKTPPATPRKIRIEPEEVAERRVEPVKTQPAPEPEATTSRPADTVPQSRDRDIDPPAAVAPPETTAAPQPATLPEQQPVSLRVTRDSDPILEGVDEPDDTPDDSSTAGDATAAESEPQGQRKKPDSWLRRIFDPGRWGR
ncbi:MAG: 5'/3'-nucleotidase SurE [Proteobacteria bacterium]|nr:5'/3'-nucleotidase SurE [Pseudomonadota bacterium]